MPTLDDLAARCRSVAVALDVAADNGNTVQTGELMAAIDDAVALLNEIEQQSGARPEPVGAEIVPVLLSRDDAERFCRDLEPGEDDVQEPPPHHRRLLWALEAALAGEQV